jgi:molybdopterin-guanine dinucleotide biosynthesis protein A
MLTLAILAGGKSLRMGQDKSTVHFQGEALVQRVINRLIGLATEVIIIAPRTQEFLSFGFKVTEDLIPGRGSLGGLYTAFVTAAHDAVAVVACDMPFVNADLMAYQQKILISDNYDVVVPSSAKGLEPLHAIYLRTTSLPPVKEALDAGKQRLISWYPRVNVRILTQEETKPFDPRGLLFLNVNTPDELSLAEKLADEHDRASNASELS